MEVVVLQEVLDQAGPCEMGDESDYCHEDHRHRRLRTNFTMASEFERILELSSSTTLPELAAGFDDSVSVS